MAEMPAGYSELLTATAHQVHRAVLVRDALEVEQDVDDIFLHAFNAGVFVQHAFDLHFGDRGAGHGRKQHTPQGIAERHTITTLKRADNKFAIVSSFSFTLDLRHNHVCDTRHGSPLPLLENRLRPAM